MNKLDLHRTRHEDVRSKTIRFVEDNWASGEEVEIVTGNSPKMKGLVIEILNEYSLIYRNPMFDLYNTGYILVLME